MNKEFEKLKLLTVNLIEDTVSAGHESNFKLGVSISAYRNKFGIQGHSGFLVANVIDKKNYFIHFSADRQLVHEPFDVSEAFVWLDFIESSSVDFFVSQLYLILSENKTSIPFGMISGDSNFFDKITGKKSSDLGLTCATFVLKVLEEAGFKIFDRVGWGSDKDWQNRCFKRIEQNQLNTPNFVYREKESIGKAPRFRPEHLVGGCFYFRKDALEFDFVENFAAPQVINELERLELL